MRQTTVGSAFFTVCPLRSRSERNRSFEKTELIDGSAEVTRK